MAASRRSTKYSTTAAAVKHGLTRRSLGECGVARGARQMRRRVFGVPTAAKRFAVHGDGGSGGKGVFGLPGRRLLHGGDVQCLEDVVVRGVTRALGMLNSKPRQSPFRVASSPADDSAQPLPTGKRRRDHRSEYAPKREAPARCVAGIGKLRENLPPLNKDASLAITRDASKIAWCGREDLNLHSLAGTWPSTRRVCHSATSA